MFALGVCMCVVCCVQKKQNFSASKNQWYCYGIDAVDSSLEQELHFWFCELSVFCFMISVLIFHCLVNVWCLLICRSFGQCIPHSCSFQADTLNRLEYPKHNSVEYCLLVRRALALVQLLQLLALVVVLALLGVLLLPLLLALLAWHLCLLNFVVLFETRPSSLLQNTNRKFTMKFENKTTEKREKPTCAWWRYNWCCYYNRWCCILLCSRRVRCIGCVVHQATYVNWSIISDPILCCVGCAVERSVALFNQSKVAKVMKLTQLILFIKKNKFHLKV